MSGCNRKVFIPAYDLSMFEKNEGEFQHGEFKLNVKTEPFILPRFHALLRDCSAP